MQLVLLLAISTVQLSLWCLLLPADSWQLVFFIFLSLGMLGMLIAWRISPAWLGRILPVSSNMISKSELYQQRTQQLARRSSLPVPEVHAVNQSGVLACAMGGARRRALIRLDADFLQAMTAEETDAILAHELGHIALGHTAQLTLLQSALLPVLLLPALLPGLIMCLLWWRHRSLVHDVRSALSVLPYVIFPLTSLLVMIMMRRWEYAADRFAARLVGKSAVLATLRCLHGVLMPEASWSQLTAFRQERLHWLYSRISTHPTIPQRITALWR